MPLLGLRRKCCPRRGLEKTQKERISKMKTLPAYTIKHTRQWVWKFIRPTILFLAFVVFLFLSVGFITGCSGQQIAAGECRQEALYCADVAKGRIGYAVTGHYYIGKVKVPTGHAWAEIWDEEKKEWQVVTANISPVIVNPDQSWKGRGEKYFTPSEWWAFRESLKPQRQTNADN